MTAVLVDDEYYALQGLKTTLEELGNIQVIATYENALDALCNIEKLQPDIVFTDIDMPQMNGKELFVKIMERSPNTKIVFVTAYNQYAVQAFELNAMDYLLKPVCPERIIKTLERFYDSPGYKERKQMFIRCFGYISIKVNDVEVDISWRTKKAQELFAYLLCAKGEYVAKEKLIDLLWPNLDVEKGKSNFYLAYHYLKKQSEQTGIYVPLESVRGKIRLNMENIETDLTEFEEAVLKLQDITDDTIFYAENTSELCDKPLFDGHYYEWSTDMMWKYEIMQRELNQKIAKYYRERNNREKEDYYRIRAAR